MNAQPVQLRLEKNQASLALNKAEISRLREKKYIWESGERVLKFVPFNGQVDITCAPEIFQIDFNMDTLELLQPSQDVMTVTVCSGVAKFTLNIISKGDTSLCR